MKALLLLSLLCFSTSAWAQCPNWIQASSNNLPLCPEGSGPTLVPETFPVAAVVVSDGYQQDVTPSFTADVVEKILRASGDNTPVIILPVKNNTLDRIKERIDGLSVSDEQKAKWKASLKQVSNNSYIWQQDYMQPYIDPQTGRIILRQVEKETRGNMFFDQVMDGAKGCGFEKGAPLTGSELASGMLGGNIETLPGGICLLGDDAFSSEEKYQDYKKQACGSAKEAIRVPTSWLQVGHTDEVIKVIRNNKSKAPCDFAVTLASPDKALELMKKNPQDLFYNFARTEGESNPHFVVRKRENLTKLQGSQNLCRKYAMAKESQSIPPENSKGESVRGVSKLTPSQKNNPSRAIASDFAEDEEENKIFDQCAQMTNAEAYKLITQDEQFKKYNQLVQSKMNSLRGDVQSQLKNRFPQCQVEIVDVPNLFFGTELVKKSGGDELPLAQGNSILPNPTNSISINDTLISPEPTNASFRKYLVGEYTKRGLKTEFVDTYEYAHIRRGNLHCATNTIHTCRPRGAK